MGLREYDKHAIEGATSSYNNSKMVFSTQ